MSPLQTTINYNDINPRRVLIVTFQYSVDSMQNSRSHKNKSYGKRMRMQLS